MFVVSHVVFGYLPLKNSLNFFWSIVFSTSRGATKMLFSRKYTFSESKSATIVVFNFVSFVSNCEAKRDCNSDSFFNPHELTKMVLQSSTKFEGTKVYH